MAASIMESPEGKLRGKSAAEVIPVDSDISRLLDTTETGQAEITLGRDGSARQFSLNFSRLKGRREEPIGQLLLLHDVTAQKQAQQRLLEQQGVVDTLQERERLARELHDGIVQVVGYLGIQAQTAPKPVRDGKNEKAESVLGQLAEVAKDAHADVRESIFNLRAESGERWSFIPALRKYLDKYQAIYGIRAELSLHGNTGEETFDSASGTQILRAIQEALTNSRKHSGTNILRIRIETEGSHVAVTIRDEGTGFDAGLLERSDDHHFGLIFMRERMEQIGGSLKVESTPGKGTCLRLYVPFRKPGQNLR